MSIPIEVDMEQPRRTARHDFRFTVVPAALLATLLVVTVIGAIVTPEGAGQLGGDFPAFFGAGSIVAEAGYDDLYDAATQRAAQEGLIANEGGYLFFAYPPFVATGYSWLASLGYRGAYVVQMLLMGAAATATVLLLRPLSDTVRRYPLAVLAAVVLFQPLLTSLIGGQNTALTMLLLAAAARAEHDGRPVLAGVAVGLLAYKPQYGVPLALVIAMSGRWRVLAGLGGTWAALYAAGAAAMGPGWVGPWWEQATAFRDTNATVNGELFVSWPGFIEHVTGIGGDAGRILSLAVGAAGVLALVWLWRRPGISPGVRYGVAALGLVLIAPQSLFYEAGVALLTLLLLVEWDDRALGLGIAVWLGGWLYAATAGFLNTTVLVAALSAVVVLATTTALRPSRPLGTEVAA